MSSCLDLAALHRAAECGLSPLSILAAIVLMRWPRIATQRGQLLARIGHMVGGIDRGGVCPAQTYAASHTRLLRDFPAGGVSDCICPLYATLMVFF